MGLLLVLLLVGADYDDARARLRARQAELSARYATASVEERVEVLRAARREIERAVVEELIPVWIGTTWEFYGTSEEPQKGAIACGYFVSTILEHAGFRIERVRLAQQAAEYIIRSFSPESSIRRFRNRSTAEVVKAVAEMGDGVYIVGLDYHVGYLVVEDDSVTFCHSSYLPPVAVACKPASEDPAMQSAYHVVGRLFEDGMMRAWLTGVEIPTVVK